MHFRRWTILLFLLAAVLTISSPQLTAETKTVEFQGRVSAVDLGANTLSVRARKKAFVFSIDIHRCNIVKEGYYLFQTGGQPGILRSARVGDAVVGTLELEPAGPVVTRLISPPNPSQVFR